MANVEHAKLAEARKTMGFPSNLTDFDTSVTFIREHISPILARQIGNINRSAEKVHGALVAMESGDGRPLSRVARSVIYLREHPIKNLYVRAQTFLNKEETGNFVFWYDLAVESDDATVCIDRAEGVFRRGARAEAVHAFADNLPDQSVLEKAAKRFERYSQMLTANPSGQTLVDFQAFRTLRDLFGLPNSEYEPRNGYDLAVSLLGPIYASALYEAVYPLSG